MLGSWVLLAIALLCCVFGVKMFITGEADIDVFRGGILCLISTVALTGLLLIDGLRFYYRQISTQLDWLLKPSGTLGASSKTRAKGAAPTHGDLVRFHVIGKDQTTGLETEMVVQVANETEALKAGERRGIEVQRVALAD